ncbi:MAG: hypothetical protein AB7O70_04260 [Hyphomicrobiales bacterium]
MAHTSDKCAQESMLTLGMVFPGYDQMPEHLKPAAVMAARMQGEWMRLAAKRAQAWIGLPQQVLACRDAGDLAKVQTDFWAGMADQYSSCARNCMSAGSEPPVHHDAPKPDNGNDRAVQAPAQRKAA